MIRKTLCIHIFIQGEQDVTVHHSEMGYMLAVEATVNVHCLQLPTSTGSDPHGHVTEVTYAVGAHESHSECMVLPVTVGIASDPYGHVT